jgi:hypothetical protein
MAQTACLTHPTTIVELPKLMPFGTEIIKETAVQRTIVSHIQRIFRLEPYSVAVENMKALPDRVTGVANLVSTTFRMPVRTARVPRVQCNNPCIPTMDLRRKEVE